jgi:phosphatidylethanolamine/phosphatidyl-N-methylethanolamine N-methyltransferase
MYSFFKALMHNPRGIGAIFPSSKFLAQEMASHVLQNNKGVVVELGAGTGVVTQALMRAGIPPENIILIENSRALVKKLRRCFPTLHIIEGTAADLTTLLAYEQRKICTIISSLPLRSLPKQVTLSILDQINYLLAANGRYIQFTYSFAQDQFFALLDRKRISSKRIWLNLPPARVDVWS